VIGQKLPQKTAWLASLTAEVSDLAEFPAFHEFPDKSA